jgi:hypothetical protein
MTSRKCTSSRERRRRAGAWTGLSAGHFPPASEGHFLGCERGMAYEFHCQQVQGEFRGVYARERRPGRARCGDAIKRRWQDGGDWELNLGGHGGGWWLWSYRDQFDRAVIQHTPRPLSELIV